MTPDELQFVADFIDIRFWRPARKGVPHEYTIRDWRLDQEEDFVNMVILIRKYGVQENFYKKVHTYLYFGKLKYWTMGSPIEVTKVINRCDQGDFYGRQNVNTAM